MILRGCSFPDDLLYDVENHVWYARAGDGWRLGMTSVAAAMAGDVLAFTPRRVGRPVERGRSCGVIESGKWVGPVRIAFDGIVTAVNEALIARPSLASEDCYGAGWMIVAKPADEAFLAALATGDAAARAYEAWMERESFVGCDAPEG